jgi:uncharacterized protein
MVNNEWLKVIAIIGLFYVLPVVLFFYELVPFAWRFYVLIFVAVVIAMIARIYKFSAVDLGFINIQLRSAYTSIALPTFIIAILMIFYYYNNGARLDNSAYSWLFYLFFVGLSVPIQEFLFRGFLFALLTQVKVPIWGKILLSAVLYNLIHWIYREVPTITGTFLLGLVWGFYYARDKNLYSIIASHALLGSIAILLGLT